MPGPWPVMVSLPKNVCKHALNIRNAATLIFQKLGESSTKSVPRTNAVPFLESVISLITKLLDK